MVLFNYSTKEITAKVVYYGPGLCGKTSNLQFIYDNLPGNIQRGRMLSLATKTDRTLFFDFLPIDLGMIRGMRTRVQLYTVPGQVFYNSTRKLVLKGADGIVFVADSQEKMAEANLESFRNLEENCVENGIKLSETPVVLQFNKRDLPGISSVEAMNNLLNKYNAPFYESIATTGIGVHETLKAVTKLVLHSLREKYAGDREGAAKRPADLPAQPPIAASVAVAAPPPPATRAPLAAAPPPALVPGTPVGHGVPELAEPDDEPLVLAEEPETAAAAGVVGGEPDVPLPASVARAAAASAAGWDAALGSGSALEAAFATVDDEEDAEVIQLEEITDPDPVVILEPEPESEPPVVDGLLQLADATETLPGTDESFADLAAELSDETVETRIPLAAAPEPTAIPIATGGWGDPVVFAEPLAPAPIPSRAPAFPRRAPSPVATGDDDILGLGGGPAAPSGAAAALAAPTLSAGGAPIDVPIQIEVGGRLRRYRLRVTLELED